MKEFNPTYVLYDLVLGKPIGYYALTEAEQIDIDADKYLKEHPNYEHRDLGLKYDKFGLSLPEIGVPEIL